jgi:hypothetical protein
MIYIHEWEEIVAHFEKPKPKPTHPLKKLVLNIFGG